MAILRAFHFWFYVNSWGNPKWKHRMEQLYAAPFFVETLNMREESNCGSGK